MGAGLATEFEAPVDSRGAVVGTVSSMVTAAMGVGFLGVGGHAD